MDGSSVGSSQEHAGWWGRVRARPARLVAVIAGVVVLLAVIGVWFQPQALLFDTVVDEDFPEGADESASAADGSAGDADGSAGDADGASDDAGGSSDDTAADPGEASAAQEEAAGAVKLVAGTFEERNNHRITGSATVYELDDGSRTLRLEPFESENGPDLVVYLTAADHADDDEALGDDFVTLGELKGNVGNQNYDVPADVDLDRYDTAVIWCRRFTVSFGAADLE